MQILTLVAMEPPVNLHGDSLRNEKLKVLKALRPITKENVDEKVVRGQYAAGLTLFRMLGPSPMSHRKNTRPAPGVRWPRWRFWPGMDGSGRNNGKD
jgi:hypothetical protein